MYKANIRLMGMLCPKIKLKTRNLFDVYQWILVISLVFFVSCLSLAQEVTVQNVPPAAKAEIISGVVTSAETGKPLEGATIKIKNTNIATLSDVKGEFSITHSLNEGVLEISFLGYLSELVSFTNTTKSLTVSLNEDSGVLEEVEIHTGFQDIRNERFVGSAATLDSAAYNRRAGMGIVERLDGTVAGVVFNKKGGGGMPAIQIRGISTLGGITVVDRADLQSPLVVVDNFPYEGDLESINPNDVETITVLKDAAAASIWGMKAGNGVIVITTKKGKLNQPIRVNIRSNISVHQKPDQYYFPRMSSSEFIEVEKFLFDKGYFDADLANSKSPYSWPVVSPVVELLDQARKNPAFEAEANARINDYAKLDIRDDLDRFYYKEATMQQHHVGLSGGSDKHAFNFSVGYNQKGSNVQNSKNASDITINANNSYQPSKRIKIDAGINYNNAVDKTAGYHLPSRIYPYMQLEDADGNALAVPQTYRMSYADTAGNGQLLDWLYRPLEEIKMEDNSRKRQAVRLNFGASYQPLDWLSADVKYQYADQRNFTRNHFGVTTWEARDLINRFTNLNETNTALRNPVPIGGILSLRNANLYVHNLRTQLKINKTWIDHDLNILLGAEGSESNSFSNGNSIYGYNDEYSTYNTGISYITYFPMFYRSASRSLIPNGAANSEGPLNRSVSFLGNATYAYKDRYVLYASARKDGANIFGVATNNKWKPLWSTGASWDIKKEEFFNNEKISSLRLKASYGYTGNVNNRLSGSPTMQYLLIGSANINNLPNAQLMNPPNPHLRWEKVRTFNYAVDFGFFNNRLSGNIDFFHKKSTDLISNIPFDPTKGILSFTVNAASLKGNGFEANLNSLNTVGQVKWRTNFGMAYSKTIVTDVYNGGFTASDFINFGLHPAVGRLAYGISSYKWAGLDEKGDPQGYLDGMITKDYPSIFKDSVDNQIFHGSSVPLYSGFLSNSVSWKNISLSANISYRLNFYFRQSAFAPSSIFTWTNLHADYINRWQQPGDEIKTTVLAMQYPVPAATSRREEFYSNSEIHVKKGDNIRLQDVRLSYDLPKRLLNKASFNNIQLYAYANNLNIILWKAYKGELDADYSQSGSTAGPSPRIWTFGLNIGI